MKVLLASPCGGVPGGISRWTEHIIKYYNSLSETEVELRLLSMGRSTFVNINSSLLYRIRTAAIDYRKILSSYNRLLRKEQFDILHLTSSASISLLKDIYMIKKARSRQIKTIIHFRFGRIPELSQKRNWEWRMLLSVVELADLVIVLDNESFETLRAYGYKNISILPNPIAPEVNQIIESEQNLVREKRTVLFAGHVVKTKGVFELVEACNVNEVKLRMVGHVDEEMKEELLKRATCEIEILGEIPYADVIREMLKCDIFVLPTYTEGFPNVILESMAAGCIIVTTSVGAIPQILEESDAGRHGIIIEPGNAAELASAISYVIDDEELKRECRQNVKSRVNERYSMSVVWGQLVGLWKNLL